MKKLYKIKEEKIDSDEVRFFFGIVSIFPKKQAFFNNTILNF